MAKPGSQKKVSTSKIEADTDKSLLRVHKHILECPEFDAIKKRMGRLSSSLRKLSSKSPLGDGHYLVPTAFVKKADQMVIDAQNEVFSDLLPKLMDVYADRVLDSKRKLRTLAVDSDYPTAEEFEAAFGIDHSYPNYGTESRLAEIDPVIYNREVGKAQVRVDDSATEIEQDLAATMQKLVRSAVERLTPDADGKKKTFRDSLIENLTTFIDELPDRNLTGKTEIAAVGQKLGALLNDVDPDAIRSSKRIRTTVKTGLEQIAVDLDAMVSLRPKRFFEAAPTADPEDAGAAAVAA
jgi:hypothetical protein